MATYASIKYDMDLSSNATGAGDMTLLSTQTASSDSTISFTSGIDSTYKEYVFKFYDIHPATNDVLFCVNFRDGSSAYDATKTTTLFRSRHTEGDGTAELVYRTASDLAQSTGVQHLTTGTGNDNDQSVSGTLHLYDPSSTTFVKHFIATTNEAHEGDGSSQTFMAGYCNVTAAIDGVQFTMSSGDIDAGTFKLYGVS